MSNDPTTLNRPSFDFSDRSPDDMIKQERMVKAGDVFEGDKTHLAEFELGDDSKFDSQEYTSNLQRVESFKSGYPNNKRFLAHIQWLSVLLGHHRIAVLSSVVSCFNRYGARYTALKYYFPKSFKFEMLPKGEQKIPAGIVWSSKQGKLIRWHPGMCPEEWCKQRTERHISPDLIKGSVKRRPKMVGRPRNTNNELGITMFEDIKSYDAQWAKEMEYLFRNYDLLDDDTRKALPDEQFRDDVIATLDYCRKKSASNPL